MTDDLDLRLRTRLERLAQAVPLQPPAALAPVSAVGHPRPVARMSIGSLAFATAALAVVIAVVAIGAPGKLPGTGGASPAAGVASPSTAATATAPPVVTCAGITDESCQKAIALVRETYPSQVAEAFAIVVADVCPPSVLCDRLYAFDSIVLLVPPVSASWGQVAVQVVGIEGPERVEPWSEALPPHVVALLPTPPGQATASPPGSPQPSSPISSATPATSDTLLACGDSGIQFSSSVLSGPPSLVGPDRPIDALGTFLAADGYPGMPASGWRTVAATATSLTFIAQGASVWWFVTVAADGSGGWQASEYGECHLAVHLPEALVYAEWRLDPQQPPKPEAATVAVLATEQECANGMPPGRRMLAPVVVETDTTVTITLVVPRLANADCPSNPEVAVDVPLQNPLGTRTLLDGSKVPPPPR